MPEKTQKPGNTEETSNKTASPEKTPSPVPSISLPKGGGAIRGIGEKFAANPVTGTGSLSVPIFTSPGRSGFGPQISLSYDSGSGNGPFGFGWSLSLPSITRKTDKGLPKYQDAIDSDIFVLSGAEDLVPLLVEDGGQWVRQPNEPRTINGKIYIIDLYRPRIEGLFARIERWTTDHGDVHWRSISKDNILTVYGRDDKSRIFDPDDKSRIFSWLICESYDDKGNAIVYEYQNENGEGVNLSWSNECNRTRTANRYLKRIKYGNHKPLLLDLTNPGFRGSHIVQPDFALADWMFEVVFDYNEDHYEDLPLDDTRSEAEQHTFVRASASAGSKWSCRPDPFSTYRSGFEVRTYRLCHRVLMFHHFPDELGINDYLVRSTEFNYDESPVASFITRTTQSGFVRSTDGTYLKKSLPPLEFGYSQATIQDKISQIDGKTLENLPQGLDGMSYRWVDLDGEGLSGILTEQADGWFYKPNLGGGDFGPLQLLSEKPSFAALNSGRQQLMDLAGDGQIDLVEFGGSLSGFYERTQDRHWEQFTRFASLPNINWNDPNLKFLDLTGDGHADILITEDNIFTWYPSLAEQGFGMSENVSIPFNEEKGPKLIFADGTQSIYLGDMSGGGLTDLVRIRNGEVCYWPNLGYGRFGAKVTMDNSPWFDAPDIFDQKRIQLADIDGSGTIDIIYLGQEGVNIYLNQSGNSWSEAQTLTRFPHIDNLTSVTVVDLFGNGTACLVWSSPLQGDSGRPMLYIDLMGGQKPHLLINSKNNMGAETVVHYAASTKFYLKDKAEGKPWITRIPFPVHVVERVETYDRISQNHFVTSYAYHHGYFDGIEREFRGFGMVEQWDTEEFAALGASDTLHSATNIDKASHIPPVLTKTWFHTGAYLRGEEISRQHTCEYFGAPDHDTPEFESFLKTLLDDTVLPSVAMTTDESIEACRTLKGSILRQEVYARDGSPKAGIPYSVSERNYTIKQLQPRGSNQHAVFFTHANEALNYHYERNSQDPRIQHELVLEVDPFGNVLKSAAIGYGRLESDLPDTSDQKKQTTTLITYIQNDVTKSIDDKDAYRTPVAWQARTYELTGYNPTTGVDRFSLANFGNWQNNKFILEIDEEINYEETPANGKQMRLIEHVRTLFRSNNLDIMLPWGDIESLALPGESYKLAFTPGLLAQVLGTRTNSTVFTEGGYVHSNGDTNWWIPSGRIFFHSDPAVLPSAELAEASTHFFLPRRLLDPFDQSAFIRYDSYDLLPLESEDALENKVTAGERDVSGTIEPRIDYRVLQPYLMTDPNGNRSQAIFDALGMVAGAAVMGKRIEPDGKPKGDSLDGFQPDLTQAQLDAFMARPREPDLDPSESEAASIMHDLLGKATSRIMYDTDRFRRTGEPPFAATIARETHSTDLQEGQLSKLQVSFSYSDGFGREIQKKIQAEPWVPVEGGETVNPRWVGSGWTIFNNKGKPVRQYEPYFSDTHHFEFAKIKGKSPILFYDPVERVVVTLHPNHTYEKVVFDPWHQKTYDVNDTVAMDPRTDADISGYVSEYFKQESPQPEDWNTWLQQRGVDPVAPPLDVPGLDPEKKAAIRTLPHADTPTVAYFDTLGRPFLTIAHNRFKRDTNGSSIIIDEYRTQVVQDIAGNQREVIDARDRIVMKYDYDMLGSRIHQSSMEAGERWMLNDVAGKPIHAWDSRGHNFWTQYDELRRPVRQFVRGTDADRCDPRTLNTDVLFAKTEYGENQTNDVDLNLRTRVFRHFDSAGYVTNMAHNLLTDKDEAYDFKGNLLRSTRDLTHDHIEIVNWSHEVRTDETFISSTTVDALSRPIQVVAPHRTGTKLNVIQPIYNEANFLEREDVWLDQDTEPGLLLEQSTASQHTVTNIDYDEKGQRILIQYGNGAETRYSYDPETFRLIHLYTRRGVKFKDCGGNPPPPFPAPVEPPQGQSCGLQNIHYTYDPAGNIIVIRDDAQHTIYFDGEVVRPDADYTYDSLYRLIKAHGREHIGNASQPETTWNDEFRVGLAHPHDGQKMHNYFEFYTYDEVGNNLIFDHKANNCNWVRRYEYDEESLIELGKKSNRLSSTTVSSKANYTYDIHGNMTRMPHFNHALPDEPNMFWDYKDQLQMVDKSSGCKVYYIYDGTGQRVRKVIEQDGTRMEERIYIGGFEVYHKYTGDDILERETLHIMDDKQRIAMVETRTIDTTGDDPSLPQLIRYQFGNHLGSASLELDAEAAIISYEEYHPYGSTSYQATNPDVQATAKRYRYTGMERDEETGLSYHTARYYAPWLGRWVSSDPTGVDAGVNLYSFCSATPNNSIDTSGRDAEDFFAVEDRSWNELIRQLEITGGQEQSWDEFVADLKVAPGRSSGISLGVVELNETTTIEFFYRRSYVDTDLANVQFGAIRAFLTRVGRERGQSLGLSGEELNRFASLEAGAISINESGRLLFDYDKAEYNGEVSFVFQRLYEEGISNSIISVIETTDIPGGHPGLTPPPRSYGARESSEGNVMDIQVLINPNHFPPIEGETQADAYARRGETMVHELIIHGWRHAYASDPRIPSAHHLGGGHSGNPGPHSIADYEADLLNLYFRNRPPVYRDERFNPEEESIFLQFRQNENTVLGRNFPNLMPIITLGGRRRVR